jgi:Na+-transporting NADH:ubiquinone oxidoreductase subunit E
MQELANIFIKSIFIDNMVFAYFLGMCSYLAISKTVKTSVGMGFAVVFVLGITIPINYLLENYVLKEGALVWLSEEFLTVDFFFLLLCLLLLLLQWYS